MHIATAICGSLALAATLSAQTTKWTTLPKELDRIEGNSWHFKPLHDSNMRYQQIFDKAHIPVASGKVMLGFALRQEGRFIQTFLPRTRNWTVKFSETTVAAALMGTTFASNQSATTATTVFTGQVSVPRFTSGQTQSTGGRIAEIRFKNPFVYRGGNLLVEIIAADKDATGTFANRPLDYNCDRHWPNAATDGLYSWLGYPCPTRNNNLSTLARVNGFNPGGTIDLTQPVPIDSSATGKVTWPIPNSRQLVGLAGYHQFLVFDRVTNNLGLTTSTTLSLMVTATSAYQLGAGYAYWTGSGDPATQATAGGKWTGRCDVMIVQHTQ